MGYMQVFGDCWCCKRPFFFNPNRVPSIVVEGVREPVCQDCVERVNPQREAKGLPPLVPLAGAYDPEEV